VIYRNVGAYGACNHELTKILREGKFSLKRLLLAFATSFVALLFIAPLAAQRKGVESDLPFSPAPYRVGERLTYNVSFSNFTSAAHVELFLAGRGPYFNRDAIQLRAHVETTEVINAALYALNNDYTSYINPDNGLPFRTQEVLREGGRTSDFSRDYNEPAGTDALPSKLGSGGLPGTYDMLSALYRLRALPLADGARYSLGVSSDTTQYQVELKVSGHELIKTNVGSFSCIVTEVHVPHDSSVDKFRIRIYFSEDERHVPILITAKHQAGEIRAELAGSQLLQPRSTPTPTPTPPPNVSALPPTQRRPIKPGPGTNQRNHDSPGAADGDGALAGLPFKVGEQLNFNVFLGDVAGVVGTASFQVRARGQYFNRNGLLLSGVTQTTPAGQRVFAVNDQINSYVDADTLLPFRTEINLLEGTRRTAETVVLDQDRGSAVTDKGARMEVPVGTHDFISVAYALRSFNLTPPHRNAVSIMLNNRVRTLVVESISREVITLGTQSVAAIQLSLKTDDIQPDKYALRLWVSDDHRHLPLRLTAVTQLGPLRADLAIIPLDEQ
jgi:hypothetical protein